MVDLIYQVLVKTYYLNDMTFDMLFMIKAFYDQLIVKSSNKHINKIYTLKYITNTQLIQKNPVNCSSKIVEITNTNLEKLLCKYIKQFQVNSNG